MGRWVQAHREELRAYRHARNLRLRDQRSAYTRAWQKANPEKRNAKNRRWAKANPDKIRAAYQRGGPKRNARKRARRRSDLQFAVKLTLYGRLYVGLKARGVKKLLRTEALVGCSIEALRIHLERQFQPGMTWEGRREWHIDHIRPCASFDLTDPVQQQQCFHYSNLQPLWGTDNQRKGAKWLADKDH